MPFERILVAIDGSECSDRAFAKALELAVLVGASVTALAVEGPLPAYAATIGEVDEVKREKDIYFNALGLARRGARHDRGRLRAVNAPARLHPAHAARPHDHEARPGAHRRGACRDRAFLSGIWTGSIPSRASG